MSSALLSPLRELADYDSLKEAVRKGKGPVGLTGCVDSQKLHMIYGLSDGVKSKVINSVAGYTEMLSSFSMERWLSTSKLRMDSTSSPHSSMR